MMFAPSFLLLVCISCVYCFVDEGTDGNVLQLLISLQAEVNNIKAQLKEQQETCSCAGSTTKPNPAFMVGLGKPITGTSDHPVVFDTVKLNQHSVYDARHGTFRAPVNGTYQVSATLSSAANSVGFHVAFVRNLASNHVGYLYADGNIDHWQERSTSLVMHLNAGDDVWLSCLGNSAIHGDSIGHSFRDYLSHFSGFLIAED